MNKMKVLLVSPYSSKGTGGIGTWTKILIDYCLNRDDINLHFLNTVQGLHKRQSMNNKITYLLIGIIDSSLIIIRLFWNMLKFRPDIVHYTSSAGNALYKDLLAIRVVKLLFNKKIVIHWHFGRIPSIFQKKGKEYRLLAKVCRRADILISIDDASYRVLKAADINTVYVPNPIPLPLQQQSESIDVREIADKREEGVVLYVGHILQSKGLLELVEACAKCKEVKHLILVGPIFDNTMKEKLKEKAAIRDSGVWLQFVGEIKREEVWDYYKKCELFCLPSYSEGFPNVILEAMAFGCPILATKVGAIPEILQDGCGIMVEAKRVEPLRDEISRCLLNKKLSFNMGEKAHEKVLANYTIEKVYEKYYCAWKNSLK